MFEDEHLLIIVHRMPGADERQRLPVFFLRTPEGAWRGSESKAQGPAALNKFLNAKYIKTGKQFAIMRLEDFTGSSEVMVWGEEYEKFGKGLEKGSVVEMMAKIEKDNRSDALQLIAQGIKPLPEPAAGAVRENAPVPGTNGSYSRQPAAAAGAKPIVLRLDVMQHSVSELQDTHDIIVRHPGRTPVVLSCRTVDGIRLELSAGPRFAVEPGDALIDALTPWL